MKKMIIAFAIASFAWHIDAIAQEMLKFKAKTYKYDTKPNQQFEFEKDHALLSGTIKDAYGDLANEKGEIKGAIPLDNVTQGEIEDLLSGKNYDYILRVHRAYNQGADANPVAIRGLSDEERKRRGEIEAGALDPVLYRSKAKKFSVNTLKNAWNHLKAAHYLNIPELVEKYAHILAMMLCSDASMRLLEANDQEHIKMIRAINQDRTFADLILHYIPEVWEVEHTLAGHDNGLRSASFSPDGSQIVTTSSDKTAKIWNAQTGALEHTLIGHLRAILSALFSPDGSKIVTASTDGTAKIWNAKTGALEHTLADHTNVVTSASFSPDGSKIVTASRDGTAKVWDAQTGELERTLEGHTGGVSSASFSPDGRKIVTASYDKTAKIWNAQTGELEYTLAGHDDTVDPASFSPDGRKIVTASRHEGTKIWVPLSARTMEQALFLQYLQFIKNHGGQPGWVSGWGHQEMNTFEPNEQALIKKTFPRTMMQTIKSYLGFGSSSSSSSSSNNNNE